MAKKLFVLFVISCFFSTAVSMSALASDAQSADISSNKHDAARILPEDLIAVMQAEETPLLDNLACFFTVVEGLLAEVPKCDRGDITCIRAAYLVEFNNLVECAINENNTGPLFFNCNIGALIEAFQSAWKCDRGDEVCVAKAFVDYILDFVRCVSVAIGSDPGEVTSTSN
jgi:hypothetical protein